MAYFYAQKFRLAFASRWKRLRNPSVDDFEVAPDLVDSETSSQGRTPLCWPRTPKRRGPKSACRSFARSVLGNVRSLSGLPRQTRQDEPGSFDRGSFDRVV